MSKKRNLLDIGLFILIATMIFFAWDSPVIYPLKILVIFFHESSHALATIATGGQVKEFELVAEAGGHVVSIGGNRFITLTAGYIGSLLWGIIIFSMAVSSQLDRWLMAAIGLTLITITAVFGSNSFVLIFGISMGVAMIISARFFSVLINDFLLRLIGVTSMLYVPLDIYSDTIARSHLRSDAYMLAEEFGGTTIMWGVGWLIISLLLILICVSRLLKKQVKR